MKQCLGIKYCAPTFIALVLAMSAASCALRFNNTLGLNSDTDSNSGTTNNSGSVTAPSGLSYKFSSSTYIVGYDIPTENTASLTGSSATFTVDPALPAGVTLNPNTGKISGHPTVAEAATDYVVTATNSAGSASVTLNITTAVGHVVNDTGNAGDADNGDDICETATGNKVCTLRAAIEQVNATAGDETILIPENYTITVSGAPISIESNVAIVGEDWLTSIVSGGNSVRIFESPTVMGAGTTIGFTRLTLRDASVAGNGGVIEKIGGDLSATYVKFINNAITGAANAGGAIYMTDNFNSLSTNLSIVNAVFDGNSSQGTDANNFGGAAGVACDCTTLSVSRSTFQNNTSSAGGNGAIGTGLAGAGAVSIINSTFYNNTSATYGGASMFGPGTVTISTSTYSENTAGNSGGALHFQNGPTVTITNTTFFQNSAGSWGGVFRIDTGGSVNLRNNLMDGNTAGSEFDCFTGGNTVTSDGNNLTTNGAGDHGCGFSGATNDLLATDPGLYPLGDNGGYTQTHAIDNSSGAYNAGTNTGCPVRDQRGITRPQSGTCDIGAYELQ